MDEAQARAVLLAKSLEEADTRSELLSEADRRWASREAGIPDGPTPAGHEPGTEATAFLARRARLLLAQLSRRSPAIAVAGSSAPWAGRAAILFVLGAFVLGFALNELAAARRISIISFPLLGMLLWNLAVYAAAIGSTVRGALTKHRQRNDSGALAALATAVARRFSMPRKPAPDTPAPLARGLQAFAGQWARLSLPLNVARLRWLLHLCAAALALGAVGGMYLRGIALEYLAGWESTFLDAGEVSVLLQVVLGPAAALTGIPLPDAAQLAALRWIDGQPGENAARWIHLYAATAVLFIVLPRLALALHARLRARALRRDFPVPEDLARHYRNAVGLRHAHGPAAVADIVPYNFRLSDAARAGIEVYLADRTGLAITGRVHEPVRYGDEENALHRTPPDRSDAAYTVLVFNMASTPEEENHGRLLHGYRSALTGTENGAPLLVVVDASAYRARLAGQAGAAERLRERTQAWERFARAHGVEAEVLYPEDTAA